jgi:hypothetical protein
MLGAVLAALPAFAGSGPAATASPDATAAAIAVFSAGRGCALVPDHPALSADAVAPDGVPSWAEARPLGLRLTARGGPGTCGTARTTRAPSAPSAWTSFRRKQPPVGDGDDPACPS